MLPLLLLSNFRLVVYLFGALVFAAMGWLYLDAIAVRAHKNMWARGIGALLVSLSYLLGAILVTGIDWGWVQWLEESTAWLRVVGYLVLGMGVWAEPLSERPQAANALVAGQLPTWILPIVPAWVGLGYWRRASVGLERHLWGTAMGMFVLSIAEILDLRKLFVNNTDIRIYELFREFGLVWIVQLIVLLIGFWMISRWIFSYLLKRFETQITLFMGMLVMCVFALATSVFTYVMGERMRIASEGVVAGGAKMTQNNWARSGDELLKRANELKLVQISDKELLAKELRSGEQILDLEQRDVFSGVKDEKLIEGLGYRLVGEGSGRRVEQVMALKREGGWVLVGRAINEEVLEKSAQELSLVVRIYDQATVIATSSVPGYPEIASPLGLQKKTNNRLGGVGYSAVQEKLKNAEGVVVADLEVSEPLAKLWDSVGQALFWTYLTGVIVLLVMEIPAMVMARYLTRQLH